MHSRCESGCATGLVITAVLSRHERSVHVRTEKLFRGLGRRSGDDMDAALCEELLGTLSHPAGKYEVHAALAEPFREKSRLMRGRGHDLFFPDTLVRFVEIDKRELRAVDLREISVVQSWPAYQQTEIQLRHHTQCFVDLNALWMQTV